MLKGPTLPNICEVKSAFHIPSESALGLKTDEGSFGLSSKLTCRKKKSTNIMMTLGLAKYINTNTATKSYTLKKLPPTSSEIQILTLFHLLQFNSAFQDTQQHIVCT